MANWLEAAFALADEPSPRTAAREARRSNRSGASWRSERRARCLGETVVCFYYVDNGVLWLCDEKGNGGDKPHVLAPGEEPRRVAGRLRREVWHREPGVPLFNRPLHQAAEPYGGY